MPNPSETFKQKLATFLLENVGTSDLNAIVAMEVFEIGTLLVADMFLGQEILDKRIQKRLEERRDGISD